MTALPAQNYLSDAARTEGEMKTALEAVRDVIAEMIGAAASTELTISSGSVTAAAVNGGQHTIDTESDAASDDLDNIVITNVEDGRWLFVSAENTSRTVVLKHESGGSGQLSLYNDTDFSLDDTDKWVLFRLNGTTWYEVARSTYLTTRGDILTADSNGLPVRKALGNPGEILMPDHNGDLVYVTANTVHNLFDAGDFTTNPNQLGDVSDPSNGDFITDRVVFNRSAGLTCTVDAFRTADGPGTSLTNNHYTAHCLHLDVTATDTPSDEAAGVRILLEGYEVSSLGFGVSGTRYMTLTFYHKHTKTGTHSVAFVNSAADRSYVAEYTQTTTDTWEKAVITIPVDESGTWLVTGGIGLDIRFPMCCEGTQATGTTDTWQGSGYWGSSSQVNNFDSTSNNFKIALVSIHPGQVSIPYSALADRQALIEHCHYFFRRIHNTENTTSLICNGNVVNSTLARVFLPFATKMRTAPTLNFSAAGDFYLNHTGVGTALTALAITQATSFGTRLNATVASGLTAGQGCQLYFNTASRYLDFDANFA